MFTAVNQVAVSEHLFNEAAKAVSFSDPLTTAYAVVSVLVVLLWATGCLTFGRVQPQDRGVISRTSLKSKASAAVRGTRSSLVGRHTPTA